MSEKKERSALFKFFYYVLRIVTFPIFLVLYILQHPLWIALLVCMLLGVAVYFPMQEGVSIENIPSWYKNKYSEAKLQIVTRAAESGHDSFVPASIIEEVQQMQKELQAEAEEAERPKGDNYNQRIVRDDKFEETTAAIKKRGGFKRKIAVEQTADDVQKTESSVNSDEPVENEEIVSEQETLETVVDDINEEDNKIPVSEAESENEKNVSGDLDLF